MRSLAFTAALAGAALAFPSAAPGAGEVVDIDRLDVLSTPGLPGPNPQDQGRAVALGSRGNEAFVVGWSEPGFSPGGVANSANWQNRQLTVTHFSGNGPNPGFDGPEPAGHVLRGAAANFPGHKSQGYAAAFVANQNPDLERVLAGGSVAPNFGGAFDSLLLAFRRDGAPAPFDTPAGARFDPPLGLPPDVPVSSEVGAMQVVDGRLVYAGSASAPTPDGRTQGWLYVGRRAAFTGAVDGSYGQQGFWRMVPALRDRTARAVFVHDVATDAARRRVFVCGSVRFADGDLAGFLAAVRFQHQIGSGSTALDPAFNSGRIRWVNSDTTPEQCNGVDVGPGGLVTLAATRGAPDQVPDVILVHQYRANGAFNEPDFGGDGRVTIEQKDRSFGAEALVNRLTPLSPQRIYVPGIDWGAIGTNGDRRVLLAALRLDGSADEAFDGTSAANGLLRTNVLTGQVDQAFDMAAAPGLLTLTGRAGSELLVARYRP